MSLVALAIARLEAGVPELAGRVQGAADLARLMKAGQLPQHTPAAHVVPGGIIAGKAVPILAVPFRQQVTRRLIVILTLRTHDATGARALERIDALIEEIIAALAGWEPFPGTGAGLLALAGVSPPAGEAGTFITEFAFSLPDHLRIIP